MQGITLDVKHLVEVRNVGKKYFGDDVDITAVENIDFHIDDGEFVTIMGQSGSGKSTLLGMIGGLNKPTAGKIIIDSLDIYSLTGEQRADFRSEYIGIIFQSFQLIPYLTVLENVILPLSITGLTTKEEKKLASSVLKKVGLEDKAGRLPSQLSGGEQERVAIARAIVNKPPILLADEPTGNLDTKTAVEIMELLTVLNKEEGLTIIMVTHNPEASRYSGRTIKVKDGFFYSEN